jgi:hypothetical protein
LDLFESADYILLKSALLVWLAIELFRITKKKLKE